MSKDDILLEAEMSMEKSVDYMVHEFAAVRTGKASPGLVENVDVHAYGSTMKLKQLALITTPESRLLVVQPFDAGTVQDIERALKRSAAALRDAEIPFLLGGSLASWARGGPESRHDLDLMITEEDADRALEALAAVGMRPERPPEPEQARLF